MTTQLPKSLWRFYFKYAIPPYVWLLVIWMIAVVGAMAENVFFPLFQRNFIALFETPVPADTTFVSFALPTIVLWSGLLLMSDTCRYFRSVFHVRTWTNVKNRISEIMVEYTYAQSMQFMSSKMPGKINSQIEYIESGFDAFEKLLTMICSVAVMMINVGLILAVNKYVAIIFGFVLVFRIVYGVVLMRPMKKTAQRASESKSHLSGKIVDGLSNYSIVKLFANAEHEKRYVAPYRKQRVSDTINKWFWQRLFWAVPNVVWDIAFGATLVVCAILFMRGQILVSEVVFTTSIFFNVMGQIDRIITEIPPLVDQTSSATQAYRELNHPIDVTDAEHAHPLVVSHGKIEFRNVYFKYKNKYVLRDLNLIIRPGERVGLVGASGAGKTTLVNLLMRFYEPTRGQILIDGTDIRDVTQDSLRQNISFIPQDPTMFNRTLRDNIAYGRPEATDAEIRHAARLAVADKFINATEKKYDSMVGDRGIKLSGGQRQRVAIARAFLKNAPILILDEATSALDSETEIAIQKSFEKLANGRTTIAIAHRLSTLRNMDRIVVIESGRIVELGTHTQLLRRHGEYARLWKMQSGGFVGQE